MTYYRAYRPLRFEDLIGQDSVRTTLQQALAKDAVAHAYLFTGSRGTGKTSTARILARAVTCEKNRGKKDTLPEPCNECDPCKSILENRAPDIIEIDAASNRGIDDIRTLREQAMYPPIGLSKKVYIIDEVHMLTTEAFNALLKTLEEPPDHCLFILATTEAHKVPITIRSRCQNIRFSPGSETNIQVKLQRIVEREKLKVEPEALRLIAQAASGGYRDAETVLEHLATQHQPLTAAQVRENIGMLEEELATRLVRAALSGNGDEARNLLRDQVGQGFVSAEGLSVQLLEVVRRQIFSAETVPGNTVPLSLLSFALDELMQAYILQRTSPIPTLPLEIACLNIAAHSGNSSDETASPSPQRTPSHTVSESAPVKTKSEPAKPVHVITPIEQPSATVPVVELPPQLLADVRKAWKQMIDRIAKENIVLSQALKDTVFHTAHEGRITIHVRFRFHADKMNERKAKARVQEILRELTGKPWEVDFIVHQSTPATRPRRSLASPEKADEIQKDVDHVFKADTPVTEPNHE